jgi:hypothetical protein
VHIFYFYFINHNNWLRDSDPCGRTRRKKGILYTFGRTCLPQLAIDTTPGYLLNAHEFVCLFPFLFAEHDLSHWENLMKSWGNFLEQIFVNFSIIRKSTSSVLGNCVSLKRPSPQALFALFFLVQSIYDKNSRTVNKLQHHF